MCRDSSYCFVIEGCGDKLLLASEKSADQEEWLDLLTNAGAKYEDTPLETKAKSIFEFEPLDIDKKKHPLARYAGKVCLVVNVASF
jgi:hypothetical protein